jgi:predicted SAM-dependent methyltransferase
MTVLIERLKRTESPLVRAGLLRARGSIHYAARGHAVRRRSIERYLASAEHPRLEIGSGPSTKPGWLSSDLISGDLYLDLTRPLPLPGDSFAYVFGEHVIEHLSESEGRRLLAELRRILRSGGVVRLTTPDLRKVIAIYEDENPVISRADYARFLDGITGKRHERGCQILNDYLRLWGHRYVYDEEDLRAKLRDAGFEAIERCEPGASEHRLLRGLESHGGPEWVNRAEAMCLEAARPESDG